LETIGKMIKPPQITPRQFEALTLYANGFSQKEAAAKMGISHRTVHTFLDQIRERTGLRSYAACVALFVHAGVIVPNL
jgi:DNA-binding CsgD family transcriptional regulator